MSPELSPSLFRQHLLEAGAKDPENVHHVLAGGEHGQKIHFDVVKYGTDLFEEWQNITVDRLREIYPEELEGDVALLSVADGTHGLVTAVADQLGASVTPLFSVKEDDENVVLTVGARYLIKAENWKLLVILDDVGTTGGTAAGLARQAYKAGAHRVEVLNTWQRSPRLEKLDEANIAYSAVIYENLRKFTPEQCQAIGFCARQWTIQGPGGKETLS